MATTDLTNVPREIVSGNDNIVIVDVMQTIRGGRSLDVTGFAGNVIKAGHVIIMESATSEYKPMPVKADGSGYDSLPGGHIYAGVLIATIETKRAMASILVRGTVNYAAAPYPMDSIMAAVKAALPLIDFRKD